MTAKDGSTSISMLGYRDKTDCIIVGMAKKVNDLLFAGYKLKNLPKKGQAFKFGE